MCPGNTLLIFIVMIVGLILLQAFLRTRRTQTRIAGVMPGSLGKPGIFSSQLSRGEYQGVPYHYEYFSGSKNSPPYFRISIESPARTELCFVKESPIDVFFKRFGIDREVQTGDTDFDRSFYILSEDPAFAAAATASPEARGAVRAVLSSGFTRLRLCGGTLEAKWEKFRFADKLGPVAVNAALDSLILFSRGLPPEPRPAGGWTPGRVRKTALYTASIGSCAAGLIFYTWGSVAYNPLDDWTLFLESLKFSVPFFILFIWFGALVLRGRSSSHRDLTTVFWTSVFGIPWLTLALMILANGAFDQQEPAEHTVAVTQKYVTRSKNSTTYHVKVRSWRESHFEEHLTVPSGAYPAIVPGQTQFRVVTKPGALNFEWIDTYQEVLTGG